MRGGARHAGRVRRSAAAWLRAIPLLAGLAATNVAARSEDAAPGTCVDVQIGDQRFYDCLNSHLRAVASARRPGLPEMPNAAGISAPAAGLFNQAATRERMGTAFGLSVTPQRPPPPVYANPLLPAPHP